MLYLTCANSPFTHTLYVQNAPYMLDSHADQFCIYDNSSLQNLYLDGFVCFNDLWL